MGFFDNFKLNSKYHFYAIGMCYLVLWMIYYKNFYHGSHGVPVAVVNNSEEHTNTSYVSRVNFYIVSNEQWLVSIIYLMIGLVYLHHAFSSSGDKSKSE